MNTRPCENCRRKSVKLVRGDVVCANCGRVKPLACDFAKCSNVPFATVSNMAVSNGEFFPFTVCKKHAPDYVMFAYGVNEYVMLNRWVKGLEHTITKVTR